MKNISIVSLVFVAACGGQQVEQRASAPHATATVATVAPSATATHRVVRAEPVLMHPGDTLPTGEGPVPTNEWTSGRPSWFAGEFDTDYVVVSDESKLGDKAIMRERESLFHKHLVVSDRSASYAGHSCASPQFEQRLVAPDELASITGSGTRGRQAWAVRIKCGNGQLAMDLYRGIENQKLDSAISSKFRTFNVAVRKVQ